VNWRGWGVAVATRISASATHLAVLTLFVARRLQGDTATPAVPPLAAPEAIGPRSLAGRSLTALLQQFPALCDDTTTTTVIVSQRIAGGDEAMGYATTCDDERDLQARLRAWLGPPPKSRAGRTVTGERIH
jgi:hypothetical protein